MRFVPFAAAGALALALAAPAARAQMQLPRVSPNATVTQTIGTTDFKLAYSRPGVKGRVIWGGLVPYDKPWRTGANEATKFTCSDDITVEGKPLPAGTYAFLTIPGKDTWTVVFSKQANMWGAFTYKPDSDQVRVTVKPVPLAEPEEWMAITLDPVGTNALQLAVRWEKLEIPVRIEVDVNGKVLREARAAVAAAKPDDWRTPYRAASWCVDNDVQAPEAGTWAAHALATQENFYTLGLMAKLNAKAGRKQEAVAQVTKAIALAKADKNIEAEQIAPYEKLLTDWGGR